MDTVGQVVRDFFSNIQPLGADSGEALNLFVFFIQWSATILSALGGLYQARKHGMDVYGRLVIAFIVALGGGTIRDTLLGRYPIYWVKNPAYAVTVMVVAILATLVTHEAKGRNRVASKVARPVERFAQEDSKAFTVVDSLALGLWAYLGTLYSLQMGTPPVVAPIMGVVTASFGGVLRDVFFARVPQTFMPGQLYAIAAAAGAIVYVVMWSFGSRESTAFLACFILTFLIRLTSIRFNIRST